MAESHVQHKLLGMAKRRIPTLIAVITLLVVWEAWVRLGHVPSTMIAAPSEIAQATVETWPTLWPATEVTLLEGTVGFLFALLPVSLSMDGPTASPVGAPARDADGSPSGVVSSARPAPSRAAVGSTAAATAWAEATALEAVPRTASTVPTSPWSEYEAPGPPK